jgi:hypothetical protein
MNSIVIEQDADEAKLTFEVVQNSAIDRVRLARARAASIPLDGGPKTPIAVTFKFKSKAVAAPPGMLRLEIGFRVTGTEDSSGQESGSADRASDSEKVPPVILVECSFEVDYTLREGFVASPAQVRAFKDGNAVFNAWPYFREYLQDTVQRMGLPPLLAPFLRLRPKAAGQG